MGLGVGYALSCALAEAGYVTVGLDINADVVANPRREPSTKSLLSHKSSRRRIEANLSLTSSYEKIADCNYVIICVSTGDENKLTLGNVEDAVQQYLGVLPLSKTGRMSIMMVYSTLPFGSSKHVREIFRKNGVKMNEDVGYVHFPLMIAQGTTAHDFVNPPFVIFGSDSPSVAKQAMDFYKNFINQSVMFKGKLPPTYTGTPEEAELTKLVANAYLTTKIVLANEMGNLGERLGMNMQKIMEVVGSDWRIGRKFTIPGYAVGGQCFPRDLKSLIDTFKAADAVPRILNSVSESNRERLLNPIDKIEGKSVLILGKSYKPNVPETRGSPSLMLAEVLKERGYNVQTYDPKFDSASPRVCPDTVIVTLAEPEFSNPTAITGKETRVILDYADVVDESVIPDRVRLWKAGKGWRQKGGN